jgi:GNAT superfamily N-acetyltransferase
MTDRIIERLDHDRKHHAVAVLAAAFHSYPVMRHVLRDAGDDYERRLAALIGYFCDRRLTRGWPLLGCIAGNEIVAAAGVNEPGRAHVPPELDASWATLRTTIGDGAIARLERYETETDGDAPAEPHHFLGIIGVRPDAQGRGHARALIEHIIQLSLMHADSCGVCLSTETPANVPFYEHLGFRVIAERDVGDIHAWVMLRRNDHASAAGSPRS